MPRTAGPKITNEDDRKAVVTIDVKEANIAEVIAFLTKALNRAKQAEDKEGYGGVTAAGTLRVYGE